MFRCPASPSPRAGFSPLAASRVLALAILLALAAALLGPQPAAANAAPPAPHLWFRLVYPEGKPGALQGAQLFECLSADCASRALLGEAGTCRAAGCATGIPAAAAPTDRFECAEDYCLASWPYNASPSRGTGLQLALHYADGARSGPVFAFGRPDYGLLSQQWQVSVTGGGLAMAETPNGDGPAGAGLDVFLANLALTMVVELLVTALLIVLLPGGKGHAALLLSVVAGINLLTFPVVWLFFPSLTAFRSATTRTVGCLSYVPLLYALIAYGVSRVRGRRLRIALVVLLVVSLPLTGIVAWMMFFFSGYGEQLPAAAGLAGGQALYLSEAFAVIGEAFLLFLFARRALSGGRATLLSLLMNAASFGAGLAAARLLPALFV